MKKFIIPEGYFSLLDVKQTEQGIKLIKDSFQLNLSAELRLMRITAPLFVLKGTGINDDLNGVEKPVSFFVKDMPGTEAEIVQSLAKWKRLMLADLNVQPGYGIYTDMNAIRPDEELDNLHSLYVDQWDWELSINENQRTLGFLKYIVRKIYEAIKRTEFFIYDSFPCLAPVLPDNITFIHSEDLAKEYPSLEAKEREDRIAEKYGAVFIIGIGGDLSDGKPHDGRAPDYDDWSTPSENGNIGLNGDIIVWNPLLKCAFELSSMGIRVDDKALLLQLKIRRAEGRKNLYFHKRLLNGELPLSTGGGIGQSRLCMFYLKKAHIGEIQSGIWPDNMKKKCSEHNIFLL